MNEVGEKGKNWWVFNRNMKDLAFNMRMTIT